MRAGRRLVGPPEPVPTVAPSIFAHGQSPPVASKAHRCEPARYTVEDGVETRGYAAMPVSLVLIQKADRYRAHLALLQSLLVLGTPSQALL